MGEHLRRLDRQRLEDPLPIQREDRTIALEQFVGERVIFGPLDPIVHSVVVKAGATVECRANGTVIDCPSAALDPYINASTQAGIGKATLLIEEQQNWGAVKNQ